MYDLYIEYCEQLGCCLIDVEVCKYLKVIMFMRVVFDFEDDDFQRVEEIYQSFVFIKLLVKFKVMDVDVDGEDELVVLMLLQQYMEDYFEYMIFELEDIFDEDNDDLIIDFDINWKRKIGIISMLFFCILDKIFCQFFFIKLFFVNS